MARIQVVRQSPEEIFNGFKPEMFRGAYKRGMSVSAYIERMNPTETGDRSGLDAFGRVLKHVGIFTRSAPEAGIFPDVFEDAFDGDGDDGVRRRLLGLEWMTRQWRRAATGFEVIPRDVNTSTDYTPNSAMRPVADAAMIRNQQIAPAIPISEVVAITTPINSNVYRAVYIEDIDPKAKRFVRVGETAEFPRIKMKSKERDVNLYKYGRAIESSYEALRRLRLDRVALEIQLISNQVEVDKLGTIIDVAVNGDGNPGTEAPVFDLTDLDPETTANSPTLRAWIEFLMNFENPYQMNVLLGRKGAIIKAMLIDTGTGNVPLVAVARYLGIGGFRNINKNLDNTIGFGSTIDSPDNKWVGIDSRRAIERVYEVGANLTEVEKHALNQVELLVFSEVEGYVKLDKRAVKLADLAA